MTQTSDLHKASLVWMDLEMTGLDPDKDHIIEIATIITNDDLNIIAKAPEFIIHQTQEKLDLMDDWNQKHHTQSGLIQKVLQSTTSIEEADEKIANFILQYLQPKTAPLCGNSIWQDRRFIEKEMPKTAQTLHYRNIDVSTIKELAKRWNPKIMRYNKHATHRAMDDIIESIEELKYYRKHFLTNPEQEICLT